MKGHLKRGKGSQRKAEVGVPAESIPLEDLQTGKTIRFCGYFKMEVTGKVNGEHVKQFIKKNVDGDIVLFTDNNTAYSQLEDIVQTHFTVVSGKGSTNDTLRWVHKAISNLKRKLMGKNHMITYKYLQNYLSEFVYKLNRKYFGDRLFGDIV